MPAERKRRTERAVVALSIPTSGKRLIERAARRRHQTISEFIRAAAVAAAERVLDESGAAGATAEPVAA